MYTNAIAEVNALGINEENYNDVANRTNTLTNIAATGYTRKDKATGEYIADNTTIMWNCNFIETLVRATALEVLAENNADKTIIAYEKANIVCVFDEFEECVESHEWINGHYIKSDEYVGSTIEWLENHEFRNYCKKLVH